MEDERADRAKMGGKILSLENLFSGKMSFPSKLDEKCPQSTFEHRILRAIVSIF